MSRLASCRRKLPSLILRGPCGPPHQPNHALRGAASRALAEGRLTDLVRLSGAIVILLCTTPGRADGVEPESAPVMRTLTTARLYRPDSPQVSAAARQLARWALRAQRAMFTPARMPRLFAEYPQLGSALRSEEALTALVRRHPQFYDDAALAFYRAAPELTARWVNDAELGRGVIEDMDAPLREEGRREAAQLTRGLYQRVLQRLEAQGIGPGHPDLETRLEAAVERELRAPEGQLAKPSWSVSLENDRLVVTGRVGLLFSWKGSVSLKKLAALIASGGVGAAELVFFEDEQLGPAPGPPPDGGPYGRDDHWVIAGALAPQIVDREPRDTGSVFSPAVDTLYAWIRIGRVAELSDRRTRIEHRWYHEGRLISSVTLTVGSPSWRTWSFVRMSADAIGDWRVDIVSPHGEVMETLRFTIAEP